MIDLEKALQRCIDPNHISDNIIKPFSVRVGERSFRVGAKATILFAIESGDYSVDSDCDAYPKNIKSVIGRHLSKPTMTASRDALIEWAGKAYLRQCEKCEDRIDCLECEGSGEVECDLGHDHECRSCNGSGHVVGKCAECNGDGYINCNIAPIGINSTPVEINAHLVGGMFDMLPGEQIGIIYSYADDIGIVREVSFSGPGWLMIVACLLKLKENPPVRMLEVSHDIG